MQKIKWVAFYIILPLFLLFLGVSNLLNYLKETEFGINNLDVRGGFDQLVSTRSGELLTGDIVTGRFHSSFNNLGIISVRFYNQDRDSNDTLSFRLRESDKKDWYYQGSYKTDQFLPHKLFPFGFPTIGNSQNKDYVFELESLNGATNSGILIDYQNPVFIAKSTFQRSELLKNKTQLLNFLSNKFINVFGDPETRINVIIFFIPLIIYLIYLVTYGISYQVFTFFILSFSFWDIFYLKNSYDFLYLSALFGWYLVSRRFKFESRIAASFALFFLSLTPIFLIFNQESIAEKFAVWAYLFLCITVVQQIYEYRKKTKNLFGLQEFFTKFSAFNIENDALIYKVKLIIPISVITISCIFVYTLGKSIINTILQFKLYYPSNTTWNFIKGTFIAWLISFVGIYLIYLMIKKIKNAWLKLLFLVISLSLITSFTLNKSLSFVNRAKIFSLSISQTDEAWVDVAIQGINLKSMPFIGKVYIDGVEQRVVSWTDKRIIFRTNPMVTKTGNLYVITQNGSKTNSEKFIYNFK